MPRRALPLLAVLIVAATAVAADPKPTVAEAEDIKGRIADLSKFDTKPKVVAAQALGQYGLKAKSAVPHLCELLKKDMHDDLQLAIIDALTDIGDLDALPTLKATIRDAYHESVRKAAKAAVESFSAAEAVAATRTDVRPTVDDVLKLYAAAGGRGAAVRTAATDKMDALFARYAAELLGDLLPMVAKPDPVLDDLISQACRRLDSKAVHAAAVPLVGKSDRHTGLAQTMIADKAKADPKGFAPLLDACLAKPTEKHAELVYALAVNADDASFALCGRMLASKSVVARRLAARACSLATNPPADIRVACRGLIGDPDPETAAAAAALFRLTAEQQKVSVTDCLAMLADPSKEKKVLAAEVLAKIGGADELGAVVEQTDDADAKVQAAAATAAAAIVSALQGNAKQPADATRRHIRDLTSHDSASVRTAAVQFHTRPDLITAVPADVWVGWSKDKEAAVRAASVSGLVAHMKTSKEAKDRLVALAADPSADVQAAAGLAVLDINPTKRPVEWLLTADTTVVAHVQLKTLFDLPVIRKHLLADLRTALKDQPALKKFKFDPVADLDAVTLVCTREAGFGIVRGRFAKEEKLKVQQSEDQFARAALCLTDDLIVTANTKGELEELAKRKPAKPDDTKAIRALIPNPDPYLGWVAIDPRAVDVQSLQQLGLTVTAAEAKAYEGARLGVRVKDAQWALELRVFATGEDEIAAWKGYTTKLVDTVKAFLPLLSGNWPEAKDVITDLTAALDKVAYDTDKQGVTATVPLKKETMEGVVKMLAKILNPEQK